MSTLRVEALGCIVNQNVRWNTSLRVCKFVAIPLIQFLTASQLSFKLRPSIFSVFLIEAMKTVIFKA